MSKEHTKENKLLSINLNENINLLKKQLSKSSDITFRKLHIGNQSGYLIFVNGLIDTNGIQVHALQQLMEYEGSSLSPEQIEEKIISISEISLVSTIEESIGNILDGNAIFLVEYLNKAFVLDAKSFETRSISEPETESSIRGPREGFNENLGTSLSLLRRKIRSKNLKVLNKKIGEETQTNVAIAYMEGIVNDDLVIEVEKRLDDINIDGILESGYIEELIEDNPSSPFPQIQTTERPDTVAANLLEGRVSIHVDGTPFALIVPVTFWQMLQASEDYYERFYISTFLRWIRLIFLFIALFLPALYIALTTFHHEMLPTNLIYSFAAAREAIPFPALVEALIMEISFEALREAGVRLPKTIGQAVSILGALVIGTAAVEAGIVSAPMVIVVSMTGIASFTIPRFTMAITIRLLRFPLMILASIFGLFGIVVGFVIISIHLMKLRSFGIPYLTPVSPLSVGELKDVFIRMPWWSMRNRPQHVVGGNLRREENNLAPEAKK
ncbi:MULTISPECIES: spore germination protein [Bacillaceae]|uniref:Spore germination protein n=1 Tax=Evansella alkalicola TaxID=745819 RepID=A0ABS6JTN6_9BACI|nr:MULTISPECIES: spore germination protein [Bacillaceae]MBU9720612.1 spore germination protein [Bacillus alkalicola]